MSDVNFKLEITKHIHNKIYVSFLKILKLYFSRALPTSSPKKSEKKKVEISSESETTSSDDSEDELLLPRRCRAQV